MLKQGATQDRRQECLRKKAHSLRRESLSGLFCFVSGENTYTTEFPTFGENAGISTPSESWVLPLPGQCGFLLYVGL